MLESFFNKVVGLEAFKCIKERLQHRCLPEKFAKFLRTCFFTEHLVWLRLPLSHRQRIYLQAVFLLDNLLDTIILFNLNLKLVKLSILQQYIYQNCHVSRVIVLLPYVSIFHLFPMNKRQK